MKKIKKILPLTFMVSIPISNTIYKMLNNPYRGVYNLTTDLDRLVPFLKIFILPYIIWYVYLGVGLVYLCFKNKKVYYKTLLSLNIGLLICYVIYFFFQTTVPRPYVVDNDILSKLVLIIYKKDKPYNCFPSIHVTTTYIVMNGIDLINNKVINYFSKILGITIMLSTQFIKQHVILDLVFAITMSEIVFKLISKLCDEGVSIWIKKLLSLFMMKKKLEN